VLGLDNGLARLPPMGWNTWCTENSIIPCMDDYCTDKEIRSVADSMVKNGLLALGYEYVLLDDCWGGYRDNTTHQIMPDASRFPSGMKALADYIHSKGMKIGLYTDVGEKTCKGGRPGSWPYYDQDAQTFASWGIDFVKMDWCGHPGGHTAQELYSMMRDSLNKTGRPILFSMCEWGLFDVWTWAKPVGNMWRAGPDHLPLWVAPDTGQDPGTSGGTAEIIQHFAGLSSFAGPGGWNDPDFLMPGYFWESEYDQVTEFSFWCLFAAPLIVATDVRELSDKQVILNKEAIAIDQDILAIAGDIRVNRTDGGQIWSRPLSGNRWAAILYNSNILFGDVTLTLSFNKLMLPGWPGTAQQGTARDIWAKVDYPASSSFHAKGLVPHQSIMLVITPVK